VIDTLFFDMDDTLVAYDAVSELSWQQACADYLPAEDGTRVEAAIQVIRKRSQVYWSDEERSRFGRQNMLAARREIVCEAFAELGLPLKDAPAVADRFSRVRIDNMYLLPNTHETLARFRAQGFKMALVTNGDPPGQRAKIARFGLEPYFDLILIEGELGFGKPDPRVFRLALERLGSNPEQALMVGDNLRWDIAGAQAVGVRAVWYNWKHIDLPAKEGVVPFATITDLAQLPEIVRQSL
jgi:putative hydrolase of the HAD superfamily